MASLSETSLHLAGASNTVFVVRQSNLTTAKCGKYHLLIGSFSEGSIFLMYPSHHEKICIYSYSVHVENMLCMLDALSFISYALINKSDIYIICT